MNTPNSRRLRSEVTAVAVVSWVLFVPSFCLFYENGMYAAFQSSSCNPVWGRASMMKPSSWGDGTCFTIYALHLTLGAIWLTTLLCAVGGTGIAARLW